MDFPYGHNNRHHHRRDEEEEEVYPPPPPPYGGGVHSHTHRDDELPPPPFPGVAHHHQHNPPHFNNYGGVGGGPIGYPTPPPYDGGVHSHTHSHRDDELPPPPFPGVTHHHEHNTPPPHFNNYGGGGGGPIGYPPPPQPHVYGSAPVYPPPVQHVSHQPPPPTVVHHHTHDAASSGVPNQRTVRVYTKAEPEFSLTIRHGQVVLARSDPRDDSQHWIKDEKWSTKVKDEERHPSFSLVNKATGQALKHSIAATQPVELVDYNPNVLDESVLWAESKDLGDSYRCIRMINNIRLNLDAFNGDKEHGGVHDGTSVVLWEWKKGPNQRWKIVPY